MRWLPDLKARFPSLMRAGGIVFAGDVLSKFLTFLITIFLLRVVTPADYMLFGVFITILAACNQLTDLGLHQSFVKFYAYYRGVDDRRAQAHLALGFRLKAVMTIATSVVMFFAAPVLARSVFLNGQLELPIRVVGIAVASNGIHEFLQAVFQGRQEYGILTAIRLIEAVGKVIAIYLLFMVFHRSIDSVYIVYALAPIPAILLAVSYLRRDLFDSGGHAPREIFSELFQFGRWMMVASFATMLLMRIDVFMVTPMLSSTPDEVGYYAAAVRLCTPLIVLAGSVSTVFYPKAMALRNYEELRQYVRRTLKVTLPMAGVSLLYLGAVVFAAPHLFPKYVAALPIFAVLWCGYVWTILGNPLTMLVMSINKASTVAAIGMAQLALTIVSHAVFIRHFRGMGAAVSTLLMWLLAGTASLAYLYMHRRSIDTA